MWKGKEAGVAGLIFISSYTGDQTAAGAFGWWEWSIASFGGNQINIEIVSKRMG